MCSDDPFNDDVSDLVVDHPVVGATDEELVLIGEERSAAWWRSNSFHDETVTKCTDKITDIIANLSGAILFIADIINKSHNNFILQYLFIFISWPHS